MDYIGRFSIQLTLAISYNHWTLEEQKHSLCGHVIYLQILGPIELQIVGLFGFGLLYPAQNQDKSKAEPGYRSRNAMKNSLLAVGAVNIPESKGKIIKGEFMGE